MGRRAVTGQKRRPDEPSTARGLGARALPLREARRAPGLVAGPRTGRSGHRRSPRRGSPRRGQEHGSGLKRRSREDRMRYRLEAMTEAHRGSAMDLLNHYVRIELLRLPRERPSPMSSSIVSSPCRAATPRSWRRSTGPVRSRALPSSTPHHPAATSRRTAEVTTFLGPLHTRRGLGTLILERLEKEARPLGVDRLLASVSSRNEASLRFHTKHGFVECGRFREIGRKHGVDFDVVWLEKRLVIAGRLFPPNQGFTARVAMRVGKYAEIGSSGATSS